MTEDYWKYLLDSYRDLAVALTKRNSELKQLERKKTPLQILYLLQMDIEARKKGLTELDKKIRKERRRLRER